MIAGGRLWVVRLLEFSAHQFPEGIVLYDAGNKLTLYLPHPASEVFLALNRNPRGLDGTGILGDLSASGVATGLDASELEVVLDELERLQLISACE